MRRECILWDDQHSLLHTETEPVILWDCKYQRYQSSHRQICRGSEKIQSQSPESEACLRLLRLPNLKFYIGKIRSLIKGFLLLDIWVADVSEANEKKNEKIRS